MNADAVAALRCEFVPANEPWTCRIHHGIRTSLDEPQCDAIRPVKPLTAGQLDNLRRADAEGRVPHSRYIVRGLLAALAAAPLPSDTPADGLDVCDCEPEHVWPCATIPRCDEPGCERETSCGFPTPAGYRRTCGDHYRAALALTQEPRSGDDR